MPLLPVFEHDDPALTPRFDRSTTFAREVEDAVHAIVADVRARGDAAVADYTQRFDHRAPGAAGYEVTPAAWAARAQVTDDVRAALEHAAERIRWFHTHQRQDDIAVERDGIKLALRTEPLRRVGLYVPGGTARYPSSVLMTAIPAKVAGVPEVIMVTPGASAETLVAAQIAGVDRVFEIGGAQAVAALAYGTATVPRVDKIVGPGNQWVAAAKRIVFGQVDIDSVAGPSEVLIIADASANPAWVAADLLAQAEHDVEARRGNPAAVERAFDSVGRLNVEAARLGGVTSERAGVVMHRQRDRAAVWSAVRYVVSDEVAGGIALGVLVGDARAGTGRTLRRRRIWGIDTGVDGKVHVAGTVELAPEDAEKQDAEVDAHL